jgi:ribosome-binding protein aMBF1 (putative translation factor)
MTRTKKKVSISIGDPGHDKDMKNPAYRAAYENRRLIHEVALTVKSMRERAGLTQQRLAEAIGSSQPVIARLERGRDQRIPRFDLVRRIGLALGKQLKWVFEDVRNGEPLVEVKGRVRRIEDPHPEA